MTTKLEVQIRYCFCCGITIAALLIAIYTIILFCLLILLGSWGLARDARTTSEHYTNCSREAQAQAHRCEDKFVRPDGTYESRIIVCDASSYHCSLGLYTEELKYSSGSRYLTSVINLIIWVLLVVSAVLIFFALLTEIEWLLVPWLIMMTVEIVRGLISVLFIFVLCHGNLTRIAVGIFFLGVQILHISLVIIMLGKFQEMRARNRPVQPNEATIMADGSHIYPTMPAQGYSTGTAKREGYYQPQNGYNTYAGKEGTIYRAPGAGSNPYGTYGARSTVAP